MPLSRDSRGIIDSFSQVDMQIMNPLKGVVDWQKPAGAIVVSLKRCTSKSTLQQRHGTLKQVCTSSYILNTTWVPRATASPHADSITIDAADACIATGRSSFDNQRCRRKTS